MNEAILELIYVFLGGLAIFIVGLVLYGCHYLYKKYINKIPPENNETINIYTALI
jgi:hypothetical protein